MVRHLQISILVCPDRIDACRGASFSTVGPHVRRLLIAIYVASWSSFPLVWFAVQAGWMGAETELTILAMCDVAAKCICTSAVLNASSTKMVTQLGEEKDRLAWDLKFAQAHQGGQNRQQSEPANADGTGSTRSEHAVASEATATYLAPSTVDVCARVISSTCADSVSSSKSSSASESSLSSSSDDYAVGRSPAALPAILQDPGFVPDAPPQARVQAALAEHAAASQGAIAEAIARQAQVLGRRMWCRLCQLFIGGRDPASPLYELPDVSLQRIAAWVVHMETRRMEARLAASRAAPWHHLLMVGQEQQ